MKIIFKLICFTFLGLIIVLLPACRALDPHKPEKAVEAWYEALSIGDITKLYEVTHPDRQAKLEAALTDPLRILVRLTALDERKCFEMKYLVFQEEQNALVHVTGKCVDRFGFLTNLDETFEMILMDKQWYIWSVGNLF
jgi:hypothetical protein